MRLNLKVSIYLICLLSAWVVLCSLLAMPAYILPHPLDVASSIIKNSNLLAWHGFVSLLEIVSGLLVGILLAGVMIFIAERVPRLRTTLFSSLISLQTVPIFAIIPLFLLWFGHGLITKILIVGLSSFFPITANMMQGLERCPEGYRDMARLMKSTPGRFFFKVKLPYTLPYLVAGFRIAAVHAPVTVIAADWIGATHGLGYLVMLSSGRLQLDLMFSCIFILIGYSLLFHQLVCWLQRKILFWRSDS
ncbi:ABC transporter permease [Candidatus Paracaedibacter symbiosus]|uniref:ABC transporter permease n=1 Tax=Candidatus Paracaedibacter symbiosus TaxID=244582 RepID=UPI0005099744|nr:ABC transporter permease [Candidatus Paracaedibacter symbiosus]